MCEQDMAIGSSDDVSNVYCTLRSESKFTGKSECDSRKEIWIKAKGERYGKIWKESEDLCGY